MVFRDLPNLQSSLQLIFCETQGITLYIAATGNLVTTSSQPTWKLQYNLPSSFFQQFEVLKDLHIKMCVLGWTPPQGESLNTRQISPYQHSFNPRKPQHGLPLQELKCPTALQKAKCHILFDRFAGTRGLHGLPVNLSFIIYYPFSLKSPHNCLCCRKLLSYNIAHPTPDLLLRNLTYQTNSASGNTCYIHKKSLVLVAAMSWPRQLCGQAPEGRTL